MYIENFGMNGEGVAHKEDETFFVFFALPGEEVEIRIIQKKDNLNFCQVSKIIKESKYRAMPFCPYYMRCGGCDLQHMDYTLQLKFKQEYVKNTISKIAKLDVKVENCLSGSIKSYRNKMSFPIYNGKLGMYQKKSHNIVEIDACPIANEKINELIPVLKDFLKKNSACIKHFVVRVVEKSCLLTFVADKKVDLKIESVENYLKNNFASYGINLNINKKQDAEILSNRFTHLSGDKELEFVSKGIKANINSGSFMQINDEIKDKLYEYVLSLVKGKIILDAYSGAGLLSAHLASKAKKVIAVEIVKNATKSAKLLCKNNNITNIEIINGDCKKEIPKIISKNKIDCLILDPPRSGCDKTMLQRILEHQINKIIYISCSPQTLARDLKILSSEYKIESVKPFDMFPQTRHVETVVVLNKID